MRSLRRRSLLQIAAQSIMVLALIAPAAFAQGRGGAQAPQVTSPEVMPDRKIAFRVYAPQAQAVRLNAGDIQGLGQNTALTKAENGVWEIVVGPVDPGTYRYNFGIDGVTTVDPRSPFISESNNNVWSMVNVPGSEAADTKNVPRGSIGAVTYFSTTVNGFRRMHVYTPPGYERNSDKYPVFYLLHGAGDSDDSWTSVGRAGFILDNLIAAKKAKPMIVVMPAGHTRRGAGGASVIGRSATDEFVSDFVKDVMPYVEKNYRIMAGRNNTAIAGLSMGGNHTLNVGIPHLDKFAYIGVYSSGLLGAFPQLAGRGGGRGAAPTPPPTTTPPAVTPAVAPAAPPAAPANPAPTADEWAKQHAKVLGDTNLKKGLKVFWFAIGKDDFLLAQNNATVEFFQKQGFTPVVKETDGGHTWVNWRAYLTEFAPMLFQ
jgi:enterochelin esterase-like enzyme